MVKEEELPFGNIVEIDRSEITVERLKQLVPEDDGVSICVRTERGPEERGGYLFHYIEAEDGVNLVYFPFRSEDRKNFETWRELKKFIKHSIGEEWDEENWYRALQISTRIENIEGI